MSFNNFGLSELILQAISEKKYKSPTPIQAKSIPIILKGNDFMACAQTGTGKTAGFTLPILQKLSQSKAQPSTKPRALILAPTRELAIQIHDSILDYGKNLSLRSTLVYGGVKMMKQIKRLEQGTDIIVATPGRLLDLHNQQAVKLNEIKTLVLDEADRMLDMGFVLDIKKILNLLPHQRQSLLFSATFSREIRSFAKRILNNPIEINISPNQTSAESVSHKIHPVDKTQKSNLLSYLIKKNQWYQALVFCRTKHGADKLVKLLKKEKIISIAIHGNKSQAQRVLALKKFKQGDIQILVATDVAARGIDIAQLSHVVNFDLPDLPEDYIHRIGRTGRAGEKGTAISLVSADEISKLVEIENILKKSLIREKIKDFVPTNKVPTVFIPKHKPKSKIVRKSVKNNRTAKS